MIAEDRRFGLATSWGGLHADECSKLQTSTPRGLGGVDQNLGSSGHAAHKTVLHYVYIVSGKEQTTFVGLLSRNLEVVVSRCCDV